MNERPDRPVKPWTSFDDELVAELRATAAARRDAGADRVPSEARRSGRALQIASVAVGAVAVVALAVGAYLMLNGTPQTASPAPAVAALLGEPTNESRSVAERLGAGGFVETFGINTASLRQIVDTESDDVFVARASADHLCVVYVRRAGSTGTTCAPRERLAVEPILIEVANRNDATVFAVAGVTADGYDSAVLDDRRVSLDTNGLLLTGLRSSGRLEVSGPGLPTQFAPVGRAPEGG